MKRFVWLLCIIALFAISTPAQTLVLGNPSDAESDQSSSNNFLVFHNGFILSYNRSRGAANWVSWHLSGSDIGDIDRTEAFAEDPLLPASWRIVHADYTNSGFHRGHLCPSEDRSDTDENNRESFLMSNMQPQVARLNSGTWKSLEGYVQRLAKQDGLEAYQYAGCYGDNGRINNKVTIPTNCWKIVVILPEGNNDKRRIKCSTRVISVNMPNDTDELVSGWRNYRTTVDELEQITGYDFLSTLSQTKQTCLQSKLDDQ